ncbi:MAG: hypothetical protein L6Q54_07410 [Leptospiraceae bacterium]|nr:hypothetical protein [Leptospiraceae bacterium]MCK6381062.1 hypothetical protein [Leptospiraceae bacterium]NUM40599.1 hypothetical protein [Leptospiraceae bacterium]
MNSIKNMNKELDSVAKELLDVQNALNAYKDKKKVSLDANTEAMIFVEKAEKVILRAENKEIKLTEDQIRKIKNNLIKILRSVKG